MHDTYKNLYEKGKHDLKKASEKADISATEWASVKTVLSAMCKLEELDPELVEGESYRSSMDMGVSTRRGRSARTGRYVSMVPGPYYDSYGYDDRGMSKHSITDRMVDQIERMYDSAKTEHERRELDKWIERIQNGE